jgi:hypothetical protein
LGAIVKTFHPIGVEETTILKYEKTLSQGSNTQASLIISNWQTNELKR